MVRVGDACGLGLRALKAQRGAHQIGRVESVPLGVGKIGACV